MAMPAYFSLALSLLFLIASHFSVAVSLPRTNHLLRRHQPRATLRQSTGPASNGGPLTPALWCVAMNNANTSALQAALDWACGPGSADCGPIQKGGPCYDTSDIITTASYAFNDYCLGHGFTAGTCNFAGTAALTYLNPSHGSCIFPSSFTVKNASFTGPSSTAGIYPAFDISGGSHSLGTWYWPLIAMHFFLAITLFFGGQ